MKKGQSLFEIVRATEHRRQNDLIGRRDPRKKTEHHITGRDPPGRRIRTAQSQVKILWGDESGRPNRKSRSSQKDGTSHHWDRSSGATNQDSPIGSQDSRKKTEHNITGTDPLGQRIKTFKESPNNQSSGHRNVKNQLGSAGLSSPRRKESRNT